MARKNDNNRKLEDRNKTFSTQSEHIERDNSESEKEAKRKRASGVGDVIAKATSIIGIVPCEDCEKRKDWLNVNFPFNKPNPLTELQKESVVKDENIIEIYNDAFNTDIENPTINVLNAMRNKILKLSEL
ncbi:MAG: hypothetical protein WAW57_15240 [Lutibacter sp.]